MSSDEVFQFLELKLRARRSELIALLGRVPNEALSTELLLVEAAIERFESGDYGACCLCFELLEPDRLQSDPLIQFCTSCANDTHGSIIV